MMSPHMRRTLRWIDTLAFIGCTCLGLALIVGVLAAGDPILFIGAILFAKLGLAAGIAALWLERR